MKTVLKIGIGLLALLECYLTFALIPPAWFRAIVPYKDLGGTHPALDWEIDQTLQHHPGIAGAYYSLVGLVALMNLLAIRLLWKKLRGANG